MTHLTRGQKFRLGLFLLFSFTLLGGTVLAMIGIAAFEERDDYIVRFEGSVSGLSPGSSVKYNGITVGRVDKIVIDPKNVGGVLVTLSLEPETPIKVDTVAVLNLQGITGLKFIELSGGSNEADTLAVGSEIQSARSTVDLLTEKAITISQKIETLLTSLVTATSGENAKNLTTVLADISRITTGVALLLEDNRTGVKQAIGSVNAAAGKLQGLLDEAKKTLVIAQNAVTSAGAWVNPKEVSKTLKSLDAAAERIETASKATATMMKVAQARLSKKEMGQTIAASTKLVKRSTALVDRADVTLLRARDDILLALDALVDGAENFAELAKTLKDNPSALIRGGTAKERKLE